MNVLVCVAICITLHLVVSTSPATAATSCNSGKECGDNECCLSPVKLRGKRSIRAGQVLDSGFNSRSTKGTCTPLKTSGGDCYVTPRVDMDVYYGSCPCVSNSNCEGSGYRDIPLGETGKCSQPNQKG